MKEESPITKFSKASAVSGYPEWLPEVRLVEQMWIDTVRRIFESHGYCPINTAAVEDISVLASKGEDSDKEIYVLNRLNDQSDEKNARVGLHYDLTVPFSRYVAQNYNELIFPFKRYQIQTAWRGERPQEGRFREFLQADIDVVANEKLSSFFDSEIPKIVFEILQALNVGPCIIKINNRKILEGFYTSLGISDVVPVIRLMDKIDKISKTDILHRLVNDLGMSLGAAERCIRLASVRTSSAVELRNLLSEETSNALFQEGLLELCNIMDNLATLPDGAVEADLSIARGFDYYTGTVYEAKLKAYPEYPTICSGGRYENLVGTFLRRKLPGVGMSIGLTRLFAKMLREGKLQIPGQSTANILLTRSGDATLGAVSALAAALRTRGVNVEIYHDESKIGDQIRYARRKCIRYVLHAKGSEVENQLIEDLLTGSEEVVDTTRWMPSEPAFATIR